MSLCDEFKEEKVIEGRGRLQNQAVLDFSYQL